MSKSRDGAENEGTGASEADGVSESKVLEQAGDLARADGNLLWALVQYRKAAELRPDDSELAAKIAAIAAARARASEPRWPAIGRGDRVARPSSLFAASE